MAFFKKALDGSIKLTSGKYAGKTIDEIAKRDPDYLRWARKDMTVGLPLELFETIEKIMISHGIAFRIPRKKS